MIPNQKLMYVIPKNKLIYPAKGTVLAFFFLENTRCNTKEKIRAHVKRIIKDIEVHPKTKATKRSMSPIWLYLLKALSWVGLCYVKLTLYMNF